MASPKRKTRKPPRVIYVIRDEWRSGQTWAYTTKDSEGALTFDRYELTPAPALRRKNR